jgi:hypothetical protein
MFHNEMFQGGKKAVEDKRDCYGYLDNVEIFKGRCGMGTARYGTIGTKRRSR